jgi:hypothetical protein
MTLNLALVILGRLLLTGHVEIGQSLEKEVFYKLLSRGGFEFKVSQANQPYSKPLGPSTCISKKRRKEFEYIGKL